MQLLEDRIRRDGVVRDGGVLKVDSFLNHQMDVVFFSELAKEFERLYHNCGVNKILTIEASGIGIACITAQTFGCPLVFAKKSKTLNIAGDVWTSKVRSYTHQRVYDIIVSNPPYIRSAVIEELADEVKLHDPYIALDGKEDGLYFYRKIIAQAGKYLKPGGWILFEIGHDQAEEVSALLAQAGYDKIDVKKDLAGLDRVVSAMYNKG